MGIAMYKGPLRTTKGRTLLFMYQFGEVISTLTLCNFALAFGQWITCGLCMALLLGIMILFVVQMQLLSALHTHCFFWNQSLNWKLFLLSFISFNAFFTLV